MTHKPIGADDVTGELPAVVEARIASLFTAKDTVMFSVKDHGAVGDGVADDATAIAATYALLVAAGGGVLDLSGGTYRQSVGLTLSSSVPTLVWGYGATLKPDSGVTSLTLAVGRSNIPAVAVEGVQIDGTSTGGGGGTHTGIKILDHYGAILRDVQIRNMGTGIKVTDATGWSESSDFDGIYFSGCGVGIDFVTAGGTGSFGYASWGLVHVDNIPASGIGVRWGAGTSFAHSHVSELIIHTSVGNCTGFDIRGDLSSNCVIHGVLEGASAASGRKAIDLAATADVDGTRFELYFAGTWSTLVNNPSTLTYQIAYQRPDVVAGNAAATRVQSAQVFGDTQPRYYQRSDGEMHWGPGSATPTDTVLYRVAAHHLRTDGTMSARNTSGTSAAFDAFTTGLNLALWRVLSDGTQEWTDGTNPTDTNLYRESAGVLTTDGIIKSGTTILAGAPHSLAYPAFLTRSVQVGTWADEFAAQAPYNARINNGAGAVNDAVSWDIVLGEGTYTFDLYHRTGPGNGIYTVQLDAVTLTTVDGYEASAANRKTQKNGLVVATTGRRTLTLVMATKNASSSGFAALLGGFGFVRTGP